MDMHKILGIVDGKVGPQDTKSAEDMSRFLSIVSDVPTINKSAASKLLEGVVDDGTAKRDPGAELARLGRIIMDAGAKSKDDQMSTMFGRVGDELTRFGAQGGADTEEELVQRTGATKEIIHKLMSWASEQKDYTLDVIDEPEELEVDGDEFDVDDEKEIDLGDDDFDGEDEDAKKVDEELTLGDLLKKAGITLPNDKKADDWKNPDDEVSDGPTPGYKDSVVTTKAYQSPEPANVDLHKALNALSLDKDDEEEEEDKLELNPLRVTFESESSMEGLSFKDYVNLVESQEKIKK
jgi:hypothetical protein